MQKKNRERRPGSFYYVNDADSDREVLDQKEHILHTHFFILNNKW